MFFSPIFIISVPVSYLHFLILRIERFLRETLLDLETVAQEIRISNKATDLSDSIHMCFV